MCKLLYSTFASASALQVSRMPPAAVGLRGGSRAMTMEAVMENPLLDQTGLPKFDEIDASHVKPGVEKTLEALEAQFSELETNLAATSAPGYSDVIEAMEKIEAPVEYTWGVVGHLMGVKNSDELRAAHGEMQPAVIQTTTKLSQSAAIYAALDRV